MSGAMAFDAPSASTMTIGGHVIGIAGFTAGASASYSLVARDVSQELASVGTHDVAITNVRFLTASASANCQTPGQCSGFWATQGHYEVLGVAPYTANFVLDGLFAYDGSSDSPGKPLAGQITGCVHAAN